MEYTFTINDNGVEIMETEDGYNFSCTASYSDDIEFEVYIEKHDLLAFLKDIGKTNLDEVDMFDIMEWDNCI